MKKDNNNDQFDLRIEIADMMWEVDRLREIEQSYVDDEEYEKAGIVLARQKRLNRLIKNREKKAKPICRHFLNLCSPINSLITSLIVPNHYLSNLT